MIFTSGAFLLFYVVVFSVYWLMRGRIAQNGFLLAASQLFYGWWDWRFLGLMWVVILVCHFAAMLIEARWRPRLVMVVAITALLAILSAFKYFNFFAGSLQALASFAGVHLSVATLTIILPVGISFFVFEAICYVVDVWRRDIRADRSLANTALYISFFPKMMAGPIIRASDFFPQLQQARILTARDLLAGLKLFLIGFIYKAVFSDNISPFVDGVYASVAGHDNHSLVMATLGFYAQIYFDFCGYSLMAIGIARTWASTCPGTSTSPTSQPTSPTSGAGGTSRCPPGCATTCTSRWAEAGAGRSSANAT
nr:MBOAT family O-acyltransferase [Arenimonas daejeonensis]